MKELTEQQVEEINKRVSDLYGQHKAIKVEVEGEEHYLAWTQGSGCDYFDGSKFEGSLDDMTFMDYSPNDGIEFDDLSQERFDHLLQEIYDDTNVVDIVLVLEEATFDTDCLDETDNIDYGDIDYNIDENRACLVGYICEKGLMDSEEDAYIAILEFDQKQEKYRVLEYHPHTLKKIEERKRDVERICSLIQGKYTLKIVSTLSLLLKIEDFTEMNAKAYAMLLGVMGYQTQVMDDDVLFIDFKEDRNNV